MNTSLLNFLTKYESLKKEDNRGEIEKISHLLNNELLFLVKEELPNFVNNYEELLERSENMISRGYKFELKNDEFHIYSPHSGRKNKSRKLLSPPQLSAFLTDDEELNENQKELILLLLSNQNSVLALNIAVNLF